MDNRPPHARDDEILQDRQAADLLSRASELEIAQASGSPVSDLRRAAMEAGISPSAFDAALAEMQVARQPAAPAQPRHASKLVVWTMRGLAAATESRVLNIKATPKQLQKVKAMLDEREANFSACVK